MVRRNFLWLALSVLTVASTWAMGQPQRPRLVVGIVVDQMRADYVYTRAAQWGNGGFARLLEQGYCCGNTTIDYVPTVTACGHATVYTGTTPAFHGIAGNNYYLDGKKIASVDDPNVAGVGTSTDTGKKSPRNLKVTTIGDQLKLATDFKAKVVGVSLKDRSAVLPAGHSADLALWYDSKVPGFITSDYYTARLPEWVDAYNRSHSADLQRNVWMEACGVTLTMDLAIEAVDACQLGADDIPDLLAISISTTDAAAHVIGTDALKLDTIYRQLDADLERLFAHLDHSVGRGRYTVMLTADHGGTHSYPFMTSHRLPSGAWNATQARRLANERLQARFGVPDLLLDDMMFSFYINHAAIASAGLDRDEVVAEATRQLELQPMVQWAVDIEHCHAKAIPALLRERILRGYSATRSGEIFVVLTTGAYCGNPSEPGSTHGSWSRSDSHIPLLLMGWGVPHGESMQPVYMTDIAATLCALLHIEMPDACIGKPIPFVPNR